ncbi:hypothetical protein PVAP13_6NG071600 [Panicum virgatum]|uniref:Uncharacterized protein n=1 Tax=Panicum virgatum TaxID=38727 RepID=A0A8T0QU86_PANVG|nr:hypothetical protein PVAP13_6NG071600 [Panicum virgatum]
MAKHSSRSSHYCSNIMTSMSMAICRPSQRTRHGKAQ